MANKRVAPLRYGSASPHGDGERGLREPTSAGDRFDGTGAAPLAELRARGVPFRLAPRVDGAQTLAEFAARSGLRPRQVVKSLLLDRNGTGYALLVAPGDRSADFAALRRRFNVRSVRLADPEAVQR